MGLGWFRGNGRFCFCGRFRLCRRLRRRSLAASLSAINLIYARQPAARHRPIKGFIQLGQMVVYIVAAILIIATLIEKSPTLLLGGFGVGRHRLGIGLYLPRLRQTGWCKRGADTLSPTKILGG